MFLDHYFLVFFIKIIQALESAELVLLWPRGSEQRVGLRGGDSKLPVDKPLPRLLSLRRFEIFFCSIQYFPCNAGVPSPQDPMPDDLKWSWDNKNISKVHNKFSYWDKKDEFMLQERQRQSLSGSKGEPLSLIWTQKGRASFLPMIPHWKLFVFVF